MQNLKKQLKQLAGDSRAGSVDARVQQEERANLMEAIGHTPERMEAVSKERFTYAKWIISDILTKPLVAGAAVFVLLIGGWMGTVSAASNSLPGDTLYNVKRISEQAQLTLAPADRRALLHTEFAERRLNEALTLSDSDRPARAREAVDAFKREVAAASGSLRELKDGNNSETVKVARLVDREIDRLSSAIETVEEDNQEADDSLREAQEATKEASDDAVDVMVDSQEFNASEQNTRDLQETFRSDFNKIKERQTYNYGRLTVVSAAVNRDPAILDLLTFTEEDILAQEHALTQIGGKLADSMDSVALGSFRTGFEALRSAEKELDAIEAQVAEMEISVTQAVMQLNEESNNDSQLNTGQDGGG